MTPTAHTDSEKGAIERVAAGVKAGGLFFALVPALAGFFGPVVAESGLAGILSVVVIVVVGGALTVATGGIFGILVMLGLLIFAAWIFVMLLAGIVIGGIVGGLIGVLAATLLGALGRNLLVRLLFFITSLGVTMVIYVGVVPELFWASLPHDEYSAIVTALVFLTSIAWLLTALTVNSDAIAKKEEKEEMDDVTNKAARDALGFAFNLGSKALQEADKISRRVD